MRTDGQTWLLLSSLSAVCQEIDGTNTLGNKLYNNDNIISFREFELFTGVSDLTGAFLYNHNMESITLHSGVRVLGNNTFRYCNKLTGLVINEGCESFGDMWIYQCYEIATLTLPSTTTSIHQSGLRTGRSGGSVFIILATTPPTTNLLGNTLDNSLKRIYVPDASLTAYKEDPGFVNVASRIYPLSEYED